MQATLPDLSTAGRRAGFRLDRLEVLNWGTFERRIWRVEPGGDNALLTGDIGSGKSTLVDALTTLLVPHHRIVYNKAAGAETKERSLYSYIRGEYKSEKDDLSHSPRAVYVRDENTYTVLLAWFRDEGFNEVVTLAQVFWLKDNQRNPERLFVISEQPLTIAEHFTGFGADIQDLRRRLKRTQGVQLKGTFQEYANRFRQLFGIQHEQALELFYQTVSMKSVGSLTEFVRGHMLEPAQVEPRIEELRQNFDNLSRAHEAVLKAKRQIEQLSPIVDDGQRLAQVNDGHAALRSCRDLLSAWFSERKAELLETRLVHLDEERARAGRRLGAALEELKELHGRESDLRLEIDRSGGGRLQAIENELGALALSRDRARGEAKRYQDLARPLGLAVPTNAEVFHRNRDAASRKQAEAEQALLDSRTAHVDRSIQRSKLLRDVEETEAELESLRQRRSNIPLQSLSLRRDLAEAVGATEEELPFVGELLEVRREDAAWRGAIERVLHSFGLSLVVPDKHYASVSHYVDVTRLHGRVIYYRVSGKRARPPKHLEPDALPHKLHILPGTPFSGWLEAELAERFDHACCDDLEAFRRKPKAISRAGQIKVGGARHEKDDRHALDDRRRYVLGWSNADKIRALEQERARLAVELRGVDRALAALADEQKRLEGRRDAALTLLEAFREHSAIDWQEPARRIEALEAERRDIEAGSDVLRRLKQFLEEVKGAIVAREKDRDTASKGLGGLEEQIEGARKSREAALGEVERHPSEQRTMWFPRIAAEWASANPDVVLTLQNAEKLERELRGHVQMRIDAEQKRIDRLRDRLLKAIQELKREYPAETAEVDTSLESLPELGAMLARLHEEDLPRHEARFKELLNERTIQSVVLFQSQLERERVSIEEKIAAINRSLHAIEYNAGTYIELIADRNQDPEVTAFQHDLRQCLANSLDETDLYNEARFFQVKAILDRFDGREGLAELDRRWTAKVTDVRNWFHFSASERWREDGKEREFYSDSSGKSGGQKEKLAYTILGSALAYQFGLERDTVRSRSFRFVVIDEAFGRGSDPSARYGLELFNKLALQLFIVTPLQKIHVIEDYVASVHFVHNREGRESMVRSLGIEQYWAEKEAFLGRGENG
ncbi:ATP-binding protein [Sorangium sp. So ce1078]|uniref:ATP-binding protein n=1 Tax=Sorangium sp. So ce1078 TaxID=3133329 RepID=UPI003F5DC0DD